MRLVALLLWFIVVNATPKLNTNPSLDVNDDSIYDKLPTDENSVDECGDRIVFDFIVVGAGASGNIVATRLTNETKYRILLLEGGATGTGQRDIGGTDYVQTYFKTDPITGVQSLGTPLTRYDLPSYYESIRAPGSGPLNNMWNISAVGNFFGQARVVGGNQATNGGGWLVTQKKDLDLWGIPEYNAENFFPYFDRIVNATALGFPDRGTNGPIHLEYANFTTTEQTNFIDSAIEAGYVFGGDIGNGELTQGYYYQQYITLNGIRQSTSVAYLKHVVGKRNLDFRTSAIVTRILFDVFNNAIGVEYSDARGTLRKVYALREVVLTTGTLHTPKLLYNSGIGPLSILNAFGKPHRVINEIIGQKIRNQQRSTITYSDPTFLFPNFYTFPAQSILFAGTGTGTYNQETVMLSVQVSPTAPYPELSVWVFAGGTNPSAPYGQNISVSVYLNQQIYANGTLNLTSSDPLAGTIFVANSLVVEADAELVAEGFLKVREIMSFWNDSIADNKLVELAPGLEVDTIEELVSFVQANAYTACHYFSSVPMGEDGSGAPVDVHMFLRGVQRLRIVGPPIVPGNVCMGMQALACALGDKGADLIIRHHGLGL